MNGPISRRDFLKIGGLSVGALAWRPPPPDEPNKAIGLARVTRTRVGVYREPSFEAPRLARLWRDDVVTLLGQESSEEGPSHNPLWYRLSDGYVHSGYLQLVSWEPQAPDTEVPPGGTVFEVTVPYTRTYRRPDPCSRPLYRLYYGSTACVEAIVQGADDRSWYQVFDEAVWVPYFARAEHLRSVPLEELTPISPEVPAQLKRVEVSRARQELKAFEGDRLVMHTRVSTGVPNPKPGPNGIPTQTPEGQFHVIRKRPMRHMGEGDLTSDLEAYELPGVPWCTYFHLYGIALHGTYWHGNFGKPMSRGCVNLRTEEAKWLYRWTLPTVELGEWLKFGRGTTVVVT